MFSITPSLYSAYYYYAIKNFGTKEDFLKVLRKEKTEPTELMQKGIDFEKNIRDICEGRKDYTVNHMASEIAGIVKGGVWQFRIEKKLGDVLLYGYSDVIKQDTIYDIKFCNNYDIGKYTYSIQHLVYMYGTGIKKFKYLISDDKDLWIEEYFYDKNSEEELRLKVSDLLNFIDGNSEFREVYRSLWLK